MLVTKQSLPGQLTQKLPAQGRHPARPFDPTAMCRPGARQRGTCPKGPSTASPAQPWLHPPECKSVLPTGRTKRRRPHLAPVRGDRTAHVPQKLSFNPHTHPLTFLKSHEERHITADDFHGVICSEPEEQPWPRHMRGRVFQGPTVLTGKVCTD